jgi:hypothetical protein
MTDETNESKKAEVNYVAGQLANQFKEQGDLTRAAYALIQTVDPLGVNAAHAGYAAAAFASGQGIKDASDVYGGISAKIIGEMTLGQYFAGSSVDSEAIGGPLSTLMASYGGTKIKDLLQKIEKAKYVLRGRELGNASDEDAEAAKETLNTLGPLMEAYEAVGSVDRSAMHATVERNFHTRETLAKLSDKQTGLAKLLDDLQNKAAGIQ